MAYLKETIAVQSNTDFDNNLISVTEDWVTGTPVVFYGESDDPGVGLTQGVRYYIHNDSGNISIHSSRADSLTGANKINLVNNSVSSTTSFKIFQIVETGPLEADEIPNYNDVGWVLDLEPPTAGDNTPADWPSNANKHQGVINRATSSIYKGIASLHKDVVSLESELLDVIDERLDNAIDLIDDAIASIPVIDSDYIRTILTPTDGITDDEIQNDAAILEKKLDLTLTQIQKLNQTSVPSQRFNHSFTPSTTFSEFFVAMGQNNTKSFNDAWLSSDLITWNRLSNFPEVPKRYKHAAISGYISGAYKYYIFGGIDVNGFPLADAWGYNATTEEWELIDTDPGFGKRGGHGISNAGESTYLQLLADNNKFIITGGRNETSYLSTIRLSIDGGVNWTVRTGTGFTARADHAQMVSRSALNENAGFVYVSGGFNGTNTLSTVLITDPISLGNTWVSSATGWNANLSSLPQPRRNHIMLEFNDGVTTDIYVIGGEDENGVLLSSVIKYNGTTWVEVNSNAEFGPLKDMSGFGTGDIAPTSDLSEDITGLTVNDVDNTIESLTETWITEDAVYVTGTDVASVGLEEDVVYFINVSGVGPYDISFHTNRVDALAGTNKITLVDVVTSDLVLTRIRGRMVIYGGVNESGVAQSKIWESVNGINWTLINEAQTGAFETTADVAQAVLDLNERLNEVLSEGDRPNQDLIATIQKIVPSGFNVQYEFPKDVPKNYTFNPNIDKDRILCVDDGGIILANFIESNNFIFQGRFFNLGKSLISNGIGGNPTLLYATELFELNNPGVDTNIIYRAPEPEYPISEPVLARQDLIFLEFWEEKIKVTPDGLAFKNGNTQYFTDTSGVFEYESPINGANYYHTLEVVPFGTSEFRALLNDPTSHIRFNNEVDLDVDVYTQWTQWRFRVRVVENERDLENVYPQGSEDTPNSSFRFFNISQNEQGQNSDPGVYVAESLLPDNGVYPTHGSTLSDQSSNTYAVPIGALHRRNRGVWHPDYNPNGSARITPTQVMPGVYDFDLSSITSTIDCFNPNNIAVVRISSLGGLTEPIVAQWDSAFNRGWVNEELPDYLDTSKTDGSGYWVRTGSYKSTVSGRPDDLFYDYVVEKDFLDLRHTISIGGFDVDALLYKNLDLLFDGKLKTDWQQLKQYGATGEYDEGSGIFGTELLQADGLFEIDSVSNLDTLPEVSTVKSIKIADNNTYNFVDGLRTAWSDEAKKAFYIDILALDDVDGTLVDTSLMPVPYSLSRFTTGGEPTLNYDIYCNSSGDVIKIEIHFPSALNISGKGLGENVLLAFSDIISDYKLAKYSNDVYYFNANNTYILGQFVFVPGYPYVFKCVVSSSSQAPVDNFGVFSPDWEIENIEGGFSEYVSPNSSPVINEENATVTLNFGTGIDIGTLNQRTYSILKLKLAVNYSAGSGISHQTYFPAIVEDVHSYNMTPYHKLAEAKNAHNLGNFNNRDIARFYSGYDEKLFSLLEGGSTPFTLNATSVSGVEFVEQQSGDEPFYNRYGHQLLSHGGKLWLIGGNDGGLKISEGLNGSNIDNLSNNLNDVWSSTDGKVWIEETSAAEFSPRIGHQVVSYDGRMWLIGGTSENGTILKDIWSSANGQSWVLETVNPDFGAREGLRAFVFDDKMWITGGKSQPSGTINNDSWYSENGVDWTISIDGDAIWSKRADHQIISYLGKLWLFGGIQTVSGGQSVTNSVYSTLNGKDWVFEHNAPWDSRRGHRVTLHNGEIYLCGGANATYSLFYNDIWKFNGTSWSEVTVATSFEERSNHFFESFNGKLYVGGGRNDSEVGGCLKNSYVSDDGGENWTNLEIQSSWHVYNSSGAISYNGKQYFFTRSNELKNQIWTYDGVNWDIVQDDLSSLLVYPVVHKGELLYTTTNFSFVTLFGTSDGLNFETKIDYPSFVHSIPGFNVIQFSTSFGMASNGQHLINLMLVKDVDSEELYYLAYWDEIEGTWNAVTNGDSTASVGDFHNLVSASDIHSSPLNYDSDNEIFYFIAGDFTVWTFSIINGAVPEVDTGWVEVIASDLSTQIGLLTSPRLNSVFRYNEKYYVVVHPDYSLFATEGLKVYSSDDLESWVEVIAELDVPGIKGPLCVHEGAVYFWSHVGVSGGSSVYPLFRATDFEANEWEELTGDLPMGRTFGMATTVHIADGTNRMYMNGGLVYDTNISNTVVSPKTWFTEDGQKWLEVSSGLSLTIPQLTNKENQFDLLAYYNHDMVSFKGNLYIVANGTLGNYTTSGIIFRSIDNGVTWNRVVGNNYVQADSLFSRRSLGSVTVHQFTVSDPFQTNTPSLVVVGGAEGNFFGVSGLKNDTWASTDGVNWSKASLDAFYDVRYSHAVSVTSSGTPIIYVSGGKNSTSTAYSDIWKSTDGIFWEKTNSNIPTGAIYDHSMKCLGSDIYIMFGTKSVTSPDLNTNLNGAVYKSSNGGSVFTNLSLVNGMVGAPGARRLSDLAVFSGRLYTTGGREASNSLAGGITSIIYSFNGNTWANDTPIGGSAWPERYAHESITFAVAGTYNIFILGGQNVSSGLLGDIWKSKDAKIWNPVVPTGTPWTARRNFIALQYAANLIVLGGEGPIGVFNNDIYGSLDGVEWSQYSPSSGFTGRSNFGAVSFNDSSNATRIYVIGGKHAGGFYDDVYVSNVNGNLSSNWTNLGAIPGFSARAGHKVVVSPVLISGVSRNCIVITGGENSGGELNEVWLGYYDPTLTWINITGSFENIFTARKNHECIVYQNKIYIIGGLDEDGNNLSDVWVWDPNAEDRTWVLLNDASDFEGRDLFSITELNGNLYLIAGKNSASEALKDIWTSEGAGGSIKEFYIDDYVTPFFKGRDLWITPVVVTDNKAWMRSNVYVTEEGVTQQVDHYCEIGSQDFQNSGGSHLFGWSPEGSGKVQVVWDTVNRKIYIENQHPTKTYNNCLLGFIYMDNNAKHLYNHDYVTRTIERIADIKTLEAKKLESGSPAPDIYGFASAGANYNISNIGGEVSQRYPYNALGFFAAQWAQALPIWVEDTRETVGNATNLNYRKRYLTYGGYKVSQSGPIYGSPDGSLANFINKDTPSFYPISGKNANVWFFTLNEMVQEKTSASILDAQYPRLLEYASFGQNGDVLTPFEAVWDPDTTDIINVTVPRLKPGFKAYLKYINGNIDGSDATPPRPGTDDNYLKIYYLRVPQVSYHEEGEVIGLVNDNKVILSNAGTAAHRTSKFAGGEVGENWVQPTPDPNINIADTRFNQTDKLGSYLRYKIMSEFINTTKRPYEYDPNVAIFGKVNLPFNEQVLSLSGETSLSAVEEYASTTGSIFNSNILEFDTSCMVLPVATSIRNFLYWPQDFERVNEHRLDRNYTASPIHWVMVTNRQQQDDVSSAPGDLGVTRHDKIHLGDGDYGQASGPNNHANDQQLPHPIMEIPNMEHLMWLSPNIYADNGVYKGVILDYDAYEYFIQGTLVVSSDAGTYENKPVTWIDSRFQLAGRPIYRGKP